MKTICTPKSLVQTQLNEEKKVLLDCPPLRLPSSPVHQCWNRRHKNLFLFVTDEGANKLERLPPASSFPQAIFLVLCDPSMNKL